MIDVRRKRVFSPEMGEYVTMERWTENGQEWGRWYRDEPYAVTLDADILFGKARPTSHTPGQGSVRP